MEHRRNLILETFQLGVCVSLHLSGRVTLQRLTRLTREYTAYEQARVSTVEEKTRWRDRYWPGESIRMQLEYGTRERGPTCFKDSASETSTMPPVAAGNSMLMVDALIADSESEADEPERFALTVAYGRTSDDGHTLTKRDLFDW